MSHDKATVKPADQVKVGQIVYSPLHREWIRVATAGFVNYMNVKEVALIYKFVGYPLDKDLEIVPNRDCIMLCQPNKAVEVL